MKMGSNIDTIAVPRCMICHAPASDSKHIASGLDFEYETCRNTWHMWECRSCSHIQLAPRPADATLKVIYPPNYYSYHMAESISRVALACKAFIDKIKFRRILRQCRQSPSSYLDVGCGDGRYLRLMMQRGLAFEAVHGLELDARAVQAAQKQGLNVKHSRIEDATHIQDTSLDLVTMFHVIEHLADPGEVVRMLAQKMSHEGVLALETPNAESIDAKWFRRHYWGGYHFPRHWHVFTPDSIKLLLEQNGFRVRLISYQPGHSFWLFSVHHWLKYQHHMPRLAAWLHPLKNVPALAIVVAIDLIRARLGFKTSAMLVIADRTP